MKVSLRVKKVIPRLGSKYLKFGLKFEIWGQIVSLRNEKFPKILNYGNFNFLSVLGKINPREAYFEVEILL